MWKRQFILRYLKKKKQNWCRMFYLSTIFDLHDWCFWTYTAFSCDLNKNYDSHRIPFRSDDEKMSILQRIWPTAIEKHVWSRHKNLNYFVQAYSHATVPLQEIVQHNQHICSFNKPYPPTLPILFVTCYIFIHCNHVWSVHITNIHIYTFSFESKVYLCSITLEYFSL